MDKCQWGAFHAEGAEITQSTQRLRFKHRDRREHREVDGGPLATGDWRLATMKTPGNLVDSNCLGGDFIESLGDISRRASLIRRWKFLKESPMFAAIFGLLSYPAVIAGIISIIIATAITVPVVVFTGGDDASAPTAQGPTGNQGPTGAEGPGGDRGPDGDRGLGGSQGPGGPQGSTGAQGPDGGQGSTGGEGLCWRPRPHRGERLCWRPRPPGSRRRARSRRA